MSSLAIRTFLVYSQPDCTYCTKVKTLLSEKGCPYLEIDLTTVSQDDRDAFKAQFALEDRTVPKVYLNGTLIGGYAETVKWLESPMAKALLASVVEPPILARRLNPNARLPERGSAESAGLDLFAALGPGETLNIPPNEIVRVPTGWALRAPFGHYLRIAPRSGLALKGIDVLAGVVDRDYAGEVIVVLANHNYETVTIKNGDKVAQAVAERASLSPVVEVSALPITERGAGGFGSTGR